MATSCRPPTNHPRPALKTHRRGQPHSGRLWGGCGGAAAGGAGAIPVCALGGITPDRAREFPTPPNPPTGIATIGAILAANSPAAATIEMLSALRLSP